MPADPDPLLDGPTTSAATPAERRAPDTVDRGWSLAALALGAIALVAYAAHLASGIGGRTHTVVLLTVAFAAAFVACGVVARGCSRAPASWKLLALAIAAYGGTAMYYTIVPDAAGKFPSVYDLGLFTFYPLAFAALVAFVRRHVAGFSGPLWIDSAVGALVAAALGAVAVVPQLDGAYDRAVVGQLLFFLGDLGFLGFLVAAYGLTGWRDSSSLLLLAAGSAVLALGDGLWVLDVAHGAAAPGVVPTVAWPLGVLLLAAAPAQKLRGAALSSSSWAKVAIPAASAVASLPIVLFSPAGTVQNWLASVALALIVARLTMSLLENAHLLRSVQEAAITDPLTGLANRQLLFDRLEQALIRNLRRGGHIGVLFLDLDEFKTINDTHGHEVGDDVLVVVGERLRLAVRGEDTVARGVAIDPSPRPQDTIGRLGGDEFAVVLEELQDAAGAAVVAERILAEVRAPIVIGGHETVLDASIGVTLSDGALSRGAVELLRDADTAMYAAKRAGKGRYQLFEADMHEEVVARAELVRDLRSAVATGQLRLLYQPQIDLQSGRMTGVEALVRWEHPERGLITPDQFIPAAEDTGMIVAIDDWVLAEACAQLRKWDAIGLPPLNMAVNVSAQRLITGDLAGNVADVLRATQVAPERLEIELTETVAVEHDDEAVATITRVRELGVRAAIDDFGMGHSALSRLRSFPVDRLKIDRSFVAPLTHDDARGSIVDAMIAIGQSLGLQVVAEGVETREHLHALRALGCPSAQGYLFSKPVPADTIERYARADSSLSPLEEQPDPRAHFDFESSSAKHERLTRNLLAEIERLTGLESTYLTRIDWDEALQHITHARNTGTIEIPEGLAVDWSDTVCRRALEQGITYTDDVRATFPDSQAAQDIGLQTYLSVPLVNNNGDIQGTLCGASSKRVQLGPDAITIMERFAKIITQGVATQTGEDRDRTAEDRDQRAEAHDRASEARDERAEARDERAAARDRTADGVDTGAAADRAGALQDRRGGASDRTQAANDREAASADRVLSARERAASSIDELTGAHRREVGMVELEREIARAKRTKQPFALVFVDVDDLKGRNDSLGHAAGDQLLREIADSIRARLRSYDLIIRFGGDEFLCGISDVTMAEAAKRFSLVNADLAATRQASVTVGLAELGADDALEDLIARADEALYRERQQQRSARLVG